jgi:hypothetical protein
LPFTSVQILDFVPMTPSLRDMLNVGWQDNPGVFASVVDGDGGLRKVRLGKCANRNGYALFSTFDFVVHGRTASGAEAECDLVSLIPDADVLPRLATNIYALLAEASLSTKHTAGSALTCQTMTNRDTKWIFGRRRSELSATA